MPRKTFDQCGRDDKNYHVAPGHLAMEDGVVKRAADVMHDEVEKKHACERRYGVDARGTGRLG